jgi:transposase-like protein
MPSPYKGFRFSHAVWLDFCFSLGYRDVEVLLDERGIIVSYQE